MIAASTQESVESRRYGIFSFFFVLGDKQGVLRGRQDLDFPTRHMPLDMTEDMFGAPQVFKRAENVPFLFQIISDTFLFPSAKQIHWLIKGG